MPPTSTAPRRPGDWIHAYTRDLSSDDFRRLFTHDTREAYDFFTRGQKEDAFAGQPWWKRLPARFRRFMVAFTMRLPPARRALYISALAIALLGIVNLFRGMNSVLVPFGTPFFQVGILMPTWAPGTFTLILGFVLMNLLVVLEVADRLSLKGELEVAREIQLAMLPRGTYAALDIEIFGVTRPANTVGGDFYDVLPAPDGKVIVALGDVAGKGSPAALLMALLLAMLRTLVDERLEPAPLVERLNAQISRHSPASRFITFFYAVYEMASGELIYVNAGQNPPLVRRQDGRYGGWGRPGGAGHVRGVALHRGADDRAAWRAPGALQRRHHRGREPDRPAVRGNWPGAGAQRLRHRITGSAGCERPGGGRAARRSVPVHRRFDHPPSQARRGDLTRTVPSGATAANSWTTSFCPGEGSNMNVPWRCGSCWRSRC